MPGDAPRLFEIWRASVLGTHHFLAPEDFEAISVEVREYVSSASLWVVEDEGKRPVGFMGLTGFHVDALFIDPAAHGRGYGRQLIHHAGTLSGSLTVDVNEQNAGALRFYERLGFQVTGRSPKDDAGRPYPLLRMRRRAVEPPRDGAVSSDSP